MVPVIARKVVRAYLKENSVDTLNFLGWPDPVKMQEKRLLGFVARMLKSDVPLLNETMKVCLASQLNQKKVLFGLTLLNTIVFFNDYHPFFLEHFKYLEIVALLTFNASATWRVV